MKHLFLIVALFLSVTLTAQERKVYTEIGINKVKVEIYCDEGYLQQIGELSKIKGKWVNHGMWYMLDENGVTYMRALYHKGNQVWVSRDFEDYTVRYERGVV